MNNKSMWIYLLYCPENVHQVDMYSGQFSLTATRYNHNRRLTVWPVLHCTSIMPSLSTIRMEETLPVLPAVLMTYGSDRPHSWLSLCLLAQVPCAVNGLKQMDNSHPPPHLCQEAREHRRNVLRPHREDACVLPRAEVSLGTEGMRYP